MQQRKPLCSGVLQGRRRGARPLVALRSPQGSDGRCSTFQWRRSGAPEIRDRAAPDCRRRAAIAARRLAPTIAAAPATVPPAARRLRPNSDAACPKREAFRSSARGGRRLERSPPTLPGFRRIKNASDQQPPQLLAGSVLGKWIGNRAMDRLLVPANQRFDRPAGGSAWMRMPASLTTQAYDRSGPSQYETRVVRLSAASARNDRAVGAAGA